MDNLTIILLLACGGLAACLFAAAHKERPGQVYLSADAKRPQLQGRRYPADFSVN